MKQYLLSPEAKADLREIRKYYTKKADARVAKAMLERIDTACQFLAARPQTGHSRTDLTSDPVKFWQVSSYFIIYDPTPRPIEITRVLHTSRDLSVLLRG